MRESDFCNSFFASAQSDNGLEFCENFSESFLMVLVRGFFIRFLCFEDGRSFYPFLQGRRKIALVFEVDYGIHWTNNFIDSDIFANVFIFYSEFGWDSEPYYKHGI